MILEKEPGLDSSKQPTPEEIKQYEENMRKQKKDLLEFYKLEMPLLKLQLQYEQTITAIETAKFQRLELMMMKAQMMAGPKERDKDSEEFEKAKSTAGEKETFENPEE